MVEFWHILLAIVLFAGACLGNAGLWLYSHNWWYAYPLPEAITKLVRLPHVLWVACFPLVLAFIVGFDLTTADLWEPASLWQYLRAAYLILCCVVGLAVLPLITLRRALRRPPAVLDSNHTETIDIAQKLGHRPIGRSKQSYLAHLPGNEIFTVDFNEKTFHLPQLPAEWDGLSILHLSDIHMVGTPDRDFYRVVMDRCVAWEPELVCVTGDIVDRDRLRRWIVPILGRLRWRIAGFGILGNHDRWYEPPLVRRRMRRAGLEVLENNWKQLEVRGRPMVVVGNEMPWFGSEPDLSACPEGAFRLCLSHTPDNMNWARRNKIDLMLSGHNHGGQIRLPLIGSVFVPSRYSRRYDCGTFHEPPTLLHVSRGLAAEHPIRYNCRPEVTKIILRKRAT